MSQHLTRQAQKVMALATEAARELSHSYVGTEHLMLGLIEEGSNSVSDVLKTFGVDAASVNTAIEQAVQCGPEPVTQRIIPLTPRAKRAMDHAATEARNMNEKCVNPEHILLGLVQESDGVAGRVLRKLGVALETLKAEVFKVRLAQSKIVERIVRPLRAGTTYKRTLREELLSHLMAIYDQEYASRHDPAIAMEAAAIRFGKPAEITVELESALPRRERINHFVERYFAYRAPESAAHFSLRMAWHTFVALAAILGLVMLGVFLGYGWIEDVRTLARVFAAIVLLTPPAQFVAWLSYIKMRDAMWGAFGSRRSVARVILYDVYIGFVFALYIMAVAAVSRWDLTEALNAISLCGLVHLLCALACIIIAYVSGPTEIRDAHWALLDLETA